MVKRKSAPRPKQQRQKKTGNGGVTVEQIRKTATPILERYGIVRKALFGSVVRGEAGRSSDIDFLVEFPDGSTLLDLAGLEQELTKALRRKVDVVTFHSLHPLLKERVLKEAVSL